MKKLIISAVSFMVIIAAALLVFFAVKDSPDSEVPDSDLSSNIAETSDQKDTLLIYMVGSDLEARSGAGTDDLTEISESGIDLESCNVLVYAGGTQKWHNDVLAEKGNTILQLAENGFETVAEMESASMGDSDCLLDFLSFAYQSYPSSSFSLIMWDHGNGPIIGYGKDMLFDNDSLTLIEMKEALSSSPFGKDNKLAWIGFDACLMSSAELVCTWDDYADYIIASQEIEPSFGWNYEFLKDFGKVETEELCRNIVDGYISTCTAYYERKGYEDRDTTLACIDLSYGDELELALNRLFAELDSDVYTEYNDLVSRRVATRALGRASTGSEYDLIDLNDMAMQLSDIYPDEAQAIVDIIGKAVIHNGTNAQGCCGLSIYYPFYNKYYYEGGWGDAYNKIGLFSSYQSYLNKYNEIWLKEDQLEQTASSEIPQKSEDQQSGVYELVLTPEQKENFAEARVYILEKYGIGEYHVIFSDNCVENNDGVLSYEFEGKGIYIKDKFCKYWLPALYEYDNVGNIARYSAVAILDGLGYDEDSGITAIFNISLDKETGTVNLSSIYEHNSQDITGGKLDEINLDDWYNMHLYKISYQYLQRYDNGVVKPIDEWVSDTMLTSLDFCIRDDIEFVYEALDEGDYALIFEVTDTQNNKFCSEPLDIDVALGQKEEYTPEPLTVDWSEGEQIEIYETDEIKIYLKRVVEDDTVTYQLFGENNTDYTLSCTLDDIVINGNICIGYGDSIDIEAHQSGRYSLTNGISIYKITDVGVIDSIDSISGSLRLSLCGESSYYGVETIAKNQPIVINLIGDMAETNLLERYPKISYDMPLLGAYSGEQELYNDGTFKITLLSFGEAELSSSQGVICIENLSDKAQVVSVDMYSVNETVFTDYYSAALPPNCKTYRKISIWSFKDITSIDTFKIKVSFYESMESYYNEIGRSEWLDVELQLDHEIGSPDELDGNIIFDKNDVKVSVTYFGYEYGKPTWTISVENNSDIDIILESGSENSLSSEVSLLERVGAHTRKDCKIAPYHYDGQQTEVEFLIYVLDYSGTEILYKGDEAITLEIEPLQALDDEVTLEWNSTEPIVFYEDEDKILSLEITENSYGNMYYQVELQRLRSESLSFDITDIIINGNILVSNNVELSAYSDVTRTSPIVYLNAEDFNKFNAVSEITSIQFTLTDESRYMSAKSPQGQVYKFNLTGDAVIKNPAELCDQVVFDEPIFDYYADGQALYNDGDLKIDFLGYGGFYQPRVEMDGYVYQSESYLASYGLCVENLSNEYKSFSLQGASVNGVYLYFSDTYITIPPNCKYYTLGGSLYDATLKEQGITSINEIILAVAVADGDSSASSKALHWLKLQPTLKGTESDPIELTGSIVFEQCGVKVSYTSYELSYDTYSTYHFELQNTSDRDVLLQFKNIDGEDWRSNFLNVRIGAGQYVKTSALLTGGLAEKLNFKISIYDYFGSDVIYESDSVINITAK